MKSFLPNLSSFGVHIWCCSATHTRGEGQPHTREFWQPEARSSLEAIPGW